MKKNKQTRSTGVLSVGIPVLLASVLLSSCQQKLRETYQPTDGLLRFTVTDSTLWQKGQLARSESKTNGYTLSSPKAIKVNGTLEKGRQMYLRTSIKPMPTMPAQEAEKVVTRAATVTGSGGTTFHSTFGILAQAYSTGSSAPATFDPTFLNRVKATGVGTSENQPYNTDGKYFIPNGQTVKIFAYAPFEVTTLTSSNQGGLVIPNSFSSDRPSYTFKTPDWFAEQLDLCFAEATATSANSNVRLNFGHAMAGVSFFIAKDVPACTIKEIAINNIYSTGTITPTTVANQDWWSNRGDLRTFTYDRDGQGIEHTPSTEPGYIGTGIFNSGSAMLMIPQTLQDGATISLKVIPEGGTDADMVTLTAPIDVYNGTSTKVTWERGQIYDYTLSFKLVGDQTFTVTPTSNNFQNTSGSVPYTGGDFSFSVTSSYDDQFVPYKVQYQNGQDWIDLDVTQPTTLISSENVTTPTSAPTQRNHTLSTEEVYTISSTNSNALRGITTESGQSSNPTGLANGNTANCYIVQGPGWYSIPMVFGNGLRNNQKNNQTGGTLWGRYVDAYANVINDPWIKDSGHTPTSARVLWQDVEGLVRDVQIHNTDYIKFHVSKESIYEGNAVIGCFDNSGTCLWSWHIWVTPIDINSSTNKIKTTTTYTAGSFLKIPLGYVQGGTIQWKSGSVTIRFIPRTSSSTDSNPEYDATLAQQFTLTKEAPTGTIQNQSPGRYLTYQWGRKDPMRPLSANPAGNSTDAPVYPGPGGVTSHLPQSEILPQSAGVADWIKNPHKFYTFDPNTDGTGVTRKAFLWNSWVSNSSSTYDVRNYIGKSLYDPCPYGYAVPPAGSFNDLIQKADGSYTTASINTKSSGAPDVTGQTGGAGRDIDKLDLVNTSYNNGYGFGFAKFNTTYNGTTTTWQIPLLGARAVADNFANTRYGDRGFYWMASKPSTSTRGNDAFSAGMYLPKSGTPWIDVLGFNEGNVTNQSIDQQDIRNALAIIPFDSPEAH